MRPFFLDMMIDRQLYARDATYILVTTSLAMGWLLPNHYAPWNTFHTNAWVGLGLLIAVTAALQKHKLQLPFGVPALFILAVVSIPIIQHFLGLISLPSHAAISTLYLVGFFVAFLLGDGWARKCAREPVGLVLGAAVVAGIASVGLQLYQWFGWATDPDLGDFWIFPFSEAGRPFANLGQPNQLASLLLWALLGVFWLWDQRLIAARWIVLLAATFLLIGIALTESRTALLTLTLITIWLLLFSRNKFSNEIKWLWCGLYLMYVVGLWLLPEIGQSLGLNVVSSLVQRSAGELRFGLWDMALTASMERPWFGYGWGLTQAGFFAVYPSFEQFAGSFAKQSHNIVLDLALWAGWPIALVISTACVLWFLYVGRRAHTPSDLIVVGAIAVMLVHALLELPLHYGYFLWPTGILAGVASSQGALRIFLNLPRKFILSIAIALFTVSSIISIDYFKVESAFYELRFHLQRIGVSDEPMKINTLILNDWPDFIEMSRTQPNPDMSDDEIQRWHDLFIFNASALPLRKYIGALVLNNRMEDAIYWEQRACFILDKPKCEQMIKEWSPDTIQD